jgi:hypothetical protein
MSVRQLYTQLTASIIETIENTILCSKNLLKFISLNGRNKWIITKQFILNGLLFYKLPNHSTFGSNNLNNVNSWL